MEIVRYGVLGGVLGLDSTAVGQFMISRPLVAGWLAGWLAGVPEVGIAVGALLELFLLVSFPTGGARFPDGPTAAVVAVGVAVPFEGPGSLAAAVAIGLVWGQVGGITITVQRHLNGRLIPAAGSFGSGRTLGSVHAVAALVDFARAATVTAIGIMLGRAALRLAHASWPVDERVSMSVLYAGAAVSLGILLHDLGGFRRRRLLFAAGLAAGIVGARFL